LSQPVKSTVRYITSRDNPLLIELRHLARQPNAYRDKGQVLLEGDHLCLAYVQRRIIDSAPENHQALITQSMWERGGHLKSLALSAACVIVLPDALMSGLSALPCAPPIAFLIACPSLASTLQSDCATVVLDRLQDPGNVGAVLRSAAAFGFTQVLALKGTVALWSQKVIRAGMGAHFSLNLVEGLEASALEALAVPLLASSSHASRAVHEVSLPWPCAWALGHEGQGIAPFLFERCQQTLRIVQPGGQESLNVAAAAAVCLYESARQRTTSHISPELPPLS
jgi:RNA methyltransferase, TrmH family